MNQEAHEQAIQNQKEYNSARYEAEAQNPTEDPCFVCQGKGMILTSDGVEDNKEIECPNC